MTRWDNLLLAIALIIFVGVVAVRWIAPMLVRLFHEVVQPAGL